MEQERRKHCYKCKSTEHLVANCPKKKVTRREKKPACQPLVERMEDEEDTVVRHLHTKTQQLNLLERITLLKREEWTPDICYICGKVNPKHSNLECPLYEQCDRCNRTGPMVIAKAIPVTDYRTTKKTTTPNIMNATTTSTGVARTR